jgi:uncharacterized protein YndB with AHSA1/START domain
MQGSPESERVRVTHRFDASAERVYDAFLDPDKAARFLFATAAGQNVRCDIDARIGGRFTIVDRRNGVDVVHTGTYLELDRPRRIVFTLLVEKYSSDAEVVTIGISPLSRGCELTLSHEMKAKDAASRDRAREGWTNILDVAAELLVDDAPTCGIGVAQHATIPMKLGRMFKGLAETLELHRQMLMLDDTNARREDEVYRDLAARWREIVKLVDEAAARMAAQRDLPMGAHDETAWGEGHLRAFETFVKAETQVLGLLRVAADRDAKVLASMKSSE